MSTADRSSDVPASPHPSAAHQLQWRIATTPDLEAYRYRKNGEWRSDTWQRFGERVEEFAAGLIALGVEAGDIVAIAARTSYDWIVADQAVMAAGAATTTIYPTSSRQGVEHILRDSGAHAVIADGDQLEILRSLRSELDDVRVVIALAPSVETPDTGDGQVVSTHEVAERGRAALAQDGQAVRRRSDALAPTDLAWLLYTSGTTGASKGVRLQHAAWLYEAEALASLDLFEPDDVQFLWLPLSHAFGKLMLMVSSRIGGVTAVDGDTTRIAENLAEIRPTYMCSVPRVLEKVHAGVQARASDVTPRGRLLKWATEAGTAALEPGAGRAVRLRRALAERLVLRKVRESLGGRLRFLVSGSAPLDPEITRWFSGIGIPVYEGFGMTESGAATTLNRADALEWGTVGAPLPGTKVRIADDGELLVRGPGLMEGYHRNPEATSSTVVDGWLHTGDIATLTPVGNVRITDRKKNVFKTATGKWVAPGSIEAKFMAVCPYAAQSSSWVKAAGSSWPSWRSSPTHSSRGRGRTRSSTATSPTSPAPRRFANSSKAMSSN